MPLKDYFKKCKFCTFYGYGGILVFDTIEPDKTFKAHWIKAGLQCYSLANNCNLPNVAKCEIVHVCLTGARRGGDGGGGHGQNYAKCYTIHQTADFSKKLTFRFKTVTVHL